MKHLTIPNVVRACVGVVSTTTFVLLYFGLVELARFARLDEHYALLPYLFPLCIDGMVAAAYAATLHPHFTKTDMRYAWFVVLFGSSMSLVGQWLHATQVSDWAWAGPIAAAPALSMSLVWHLLYLVLKRRGVAAVPETVSVPKAVSEPKTVSEPKAVPIAKAVVAARATTTTPGSVRVVMEAKQRQDSDRLEDAVRLLQITPDATGQEMAKHLGLHNADTPSGKRTGQRWVEKARRVLEEQAA